MGIDQWREEQDWPLPDTSYVPYYLHSSGRANTAAGDGELSTQAPAQTAADAFLYDPRRPVPSLGGRVMLPSTANAAGPVDQRPAETRDDVLLGAGHRLHRQAGRRVPGRTRDLPHRRHHQGPVP